MRFWDTSAIVPLCIQEPASSRMRRFARNDGALIVWWGTRIECTSAFARRRREGSISESAEQHALGALESLSNAWTEVMPTEDVRQRAERLLRVHDLRSADALQLAAALIWARERTGDREFVSLDERLCRCAAQEGFRTVAIR